MAARLSPVPALVLLVGSAAVLPAGEVVRLEGSAFGLPVVIAAEGEGERAVEPMLLDALEELLAIEKLADPEVETPGGVALLNAPPHGELRAVDPRLAALLRRGLDFCHWSVGAHGPLGGNLYALWGLRRSVGSFPSPATVQREVDNAACEKLQLDEDGARAAILGEGRVELWGFAPGFAVDRAVVTLLEHELTNGWVEAGRIVRAFGPGPEGEGWPMIASLGVDHTTERIVLRDRAMALVSRLDRTFEIGGERYAAYLDQRTGRPREGALGVGVVTGIALDAQALATALFVMPNREGRFRIGGLEPEPAVIWFLGTGDGAPLIIEQGWAALPKWEPPEGPLARPRADRR